MIWASATDDNAGFVDSDKQREKSDLYTILKKGGVDNEKSERHITSGSQPAV